MIAMISPLTLATMIQTIDPLGQYCPKSAGSPSLFVGALIGGNYLRKHAGFAKRQPEQFPLTSPSVGT